jgi:hypothetical protein
MLTITKKIKINKENPEDIFLKIPINSKIRDLGVYSDVKSEDINSFSGEENDGYEILHDYDYSDTEKIKGDTIEYLTSSKIIDFRSYDRNNQYKEGLKLNKETFTGVDGQTKQGVDMIVSYNPESVSKYVKNANDDANIGTNNQKEGIIYEDDTDGYVLEDEVYTTKAKFKSEGYNSINTSKEPTIKEEYLLNLIKNPIITSDVFIERGGSSVFEGFLKLSEVESLKHLSNYGNGYYKINKI